MVGRIVDNTSFHRFASIPSMLFFNPVSRKFHTVCTFMFMIVNVFFWVITPKDALSSLVRLQLVISVKLKSTSSFFFWIYLRGIFNYFFVPQTMHLLLYSHCSCVFVIRVKLKWNIWNSRSESCSRFPAMWLPAGASQPFKGDYQSPPLSLLSISLCSLHLPHSLILSDQSRSTRQLPIPAHYANARVRLHLRW